MMMSASVGSAPSFSACSRSSAGIRDELTDQVGISVFALQVISVYGKCIPAATALGTHRLAGACRASE